MRFLHFSQRHNLRISAKLLVVVVGDVLLNVEVLQQRNAHIQLEAYVFGQPDFIIDLRLFNYDA